MILSTESLLTKYKERLQTKYLKAPANRNSSVGTCSRFASVSLDDFSDCSSVFSGDRGGVSPVIFHDAPKHNATNSGQKPRKCTSKEHACFSKQMIRKQMRREHVAAVEKELKQHPLAMFPHYKDHMTPELFDEVVSILDPDMSVSGASGLPTASHGDQRPSYSTQERRRYQKGPDGERESTERESTKRESTERESTKRESTERESTKRESTERESTKRESIGHPQGHESTRQTFRQAVFLSGKFSDTKGTDCHT
uniref:Uncharacterized protein n=1 Tax=Cyclopterus lumpus TaxID=8103 RepID=A0A8C2W9V1_CYCLU